METIFAEGVQPENRLTTMRVLPLHFNGEDDKRLSFPAKGFEATILVSSDGKHAPLIALDSVKGDVTHLEFNDLEHLDTVIAGLVSMRRELEGMKWDGNGNGDAE